MTYKKKGGTCSTCAGPTSRKSAKNCLPCKVRLNKEKAVRHLPEYGRYWHLKNKYNLSKEQFEDMWKECEGNCNICKNPMRLPELRRGQALDVCAVDHDHETGVVRGLLCNGCNKALGLFKDDVTLLTKAKEYLNDSQTRNNSSYQTNSAD